MTRGDDTRSFVALVFVSNGNDATVEQIIPRARAMTGTPIASDRDALCKPPKNGAPIESIELTGANDASTTGALGLAGTKKSRIPMCQILLRRYN